MSDNTRHKKLLSQAVHRYVNAAVALSWSGSEVPAEKERIKSEFQAAKKSYRALLNEYFPTPQKVNSDYLGEGE